jgi:hypothetical protein
MKSLTAGTTRPIRITGKELTTSGALANFLRVAYAPKGRVEPALRRRAVSLIRIALEIWTPQDDPDLELFRGLLELVGALDVSAVYDRLVWVALSGLVSDHPEAHRQLLEVVLGLGPMTTKGHLLCERDLRDPRYANICFRALVESEPEEFPRHLRILIQLAESDGELIRLEACLYHLFARMGVPDALPPIGRLYKELTAPQRRVTFEALSYVPQVDITSTREYGSASDGPFRVWDPHDPDVYVDLEVAEAGWFTETMATVRTFINNTRSIPSMVENFLRSLPGVAPRAPAPRAPARRRRRSS